MNSAEITTWVAACSVVPIYPAIAANTRKPEKDQDILERHRERDT